VIDLLYANKSKKFNMVGDYLESDIKEASNLGADIILQLTGKTKLPPPQNYIPL